MRSISFGKKRGIDGGDQGGGPQDPFAFIGTGRRGKWNVGILDEWKETGKFFQVIIRANS